MKPIGYYVQFLPVLCAAAVFFFAAMVLWLGSRRVLCRSRGGRDWMKSYRAEDFGFSRSLLTMRPRRWLCPILCAAGALLVALLHRVLIIYYCEAGLPFLFSSIRTWLRIAAAAGGAFCLCLLLQDLTGKNLPAVCGTLAVFLQMFTGRSVIAFLCIGVYLFFRWLVTSARDYPVKSLFLLPGAGLCAGFICYSQPVVCFLAIPLYVFALIVCLRRREKPVVTVLCPLAALLLCLLTPAVLRMGLLVRVYGLDGISRFFTLGMPERLLRMSVSALGAPFTRGQLLWFLLDAPLLFGGFFGLIAAVRELKDRRDALSLFALVLSGVLLVLSVLCRQNMMAPALAAALCVLLRRYSGAECAAPAVIYTVCSGIWYLGVSAAICLIPSFSNLINYIF